MKGIGRRPKHKWTRQGCRPATLFGISLPIAFLNKNNFPGLAAYFDNSAIYFKTFW